MIYDSVVHERRNGLQGDSGGASREKTTGKEHTDLSSLDICGSTGKKGLLRAVQPKPGVTNIREAMD